MLMIERKKPHLSWRSRAAVTDAQLRAIEAIRAAGGQAEVCYGLDCALAVLEGWGLLLGSAGGSIIAREVE